MLRVAVVVFMSPLIWAVLLLAVVFPGTFYDPSTHSDPSLLYQLAALMSLVVLALIVPLGLGLLARSGVAYGLSLCACVSMVLTGLSLLTTISSLPLVGVASLHLIAAGAVASLLLLSRGTRAEFTTTDAMREAAVWRAIESETAAEGHPVVRPQAPAPAQQAPSGNVSDRRGLSWRDFGTPARVLLLCAALLAVLSGLSDHVEVIGSGAVAFPTAASYAFRAAALACGLTAAALARRNKRSATR
jgi:hypothetical protein